MKSAIWFLVVTYAPVVLLGIVLMVLISMASESAVDTFIVFEIFVFFGLFAIGFSCLPIIIPAVVTHCEIKSQRFMNFKDGYKVGFVICVSFEIISVVFNFLVGTVFSSIIGLVDSGLSFVFIVSLLVIIAWSTVRVVFIVQQFKRYGDIKYFIEEIRNQTKEVESHAEEEVKSHAEEEVKSQSIESEKVDE